MFDAMERLRSRKYPKPVPAPLADNAVGYLKGEISHFNKENGEALSNRTPESDESFGKGFNLILAVQEQGPARIKEINERMNELDKEQSALTTERNTLQRLVDAVNPI